MMSDREIEQEFRIQRRDIDRLEADLRELRSTLNVLLALRGQGEGPGLTALLREETEPVDSKALEAIEEQQKQFLELMRNMNEV